MVEFGFKSEKVGGLEKNCYLCIFKRTSHESTTYILITFICISFQLHLRFE